MYFPCGAAPQKPDQTLSRIRCSAASRRTDRELKFSSWADRQNLKEASSETTATEVRLLSTEFKAAGKSKERKEEMEKRSVRNQQVLKMCLSGGPKRGQGPPWHQVCTLNRPTAAPLQPPNCASFPSSPLPRQGQGQTPPETGTRLAEKQKNRRKKLSGQEM
ncbi:hypothetical protein CCMA1212_009094 [Trichoderma ghanense]|uniref:Uncharacterized protein n=1 Tax=Trichoderma ghanense TaxID=65468 RepID=A0ABY2GUH4_9HYPO